MARSGNFGDVVERIFQVTTGILALAFLASGILFLWNGPLPLERSRDCDCFRYVALVHRLIEPTVLASGVIEIRQSFNVFPDFTLVN